MSLSNLTIYLIHLWVYLSWPRENSFLCWKDHLKAFLSSKVDPCNIWGENITTWLMTKSPNYTEFFCLHFTDRSMKMACLWVYLSWPRENSFLCLKVCLKAFLSSKVDLCNIWGENITTWLTAKSPNYTDFFYLHFTDRSMKMACLWVYLSWPRENSFLCWRVFLKAFLSSKVNLCNIWGENITTWLTTKSPNYTDFFCLHFTDGSMKMAW
jgi:hypothetical protein